MRADNSRGTFEEVLSNSSPAITAIAYRLREIIAQVYPEAVEVPRPGEQHADYGIAANKTNEVFGYMCPLKEYVRLGFYYGGKLPDPGGLLVGTGKRLRHIKIYTLSEAERPAIRQLIGAAVRERQEALGV